MKLHSKMEWKEHDCAIKPCFLLSKSIKTYGLTIFIATLTVNYGYE